MALSRLLAMLDAGLKEMVGFLHDSKSLKMVKRMAIEAQTPTSKFGGMSSVRLCWGCMGLHIQKDNEIMR